MARDERVDAAVVEKQLRMVLDAGLLNDSSNSVIVYDEAEILRRCERLRAAWPPFFFHTAAVKAVALPAILQIVRSAGLGAEAASSGELALAHDAGFQPGHVVFDSPCKTDREIAAALAAGVMINADSLDEVARLGELGAHARAATVGVRVNPQVGAGSIESTGVAAAVSKFGVAMDDYADELVDVLRRSPWIEMLHVHVGSQGVALDHLVRGVRRTLDLAAQLDGQITTIDIGGGLPVSYSAGEAPRVQLEEYVDALRATCPELFDGSLAVVTEFGRWLFAGAGWTVSRVEAVKRSGGSDIAVVHVGADLFIRAAYRPDEWAHEVQVHDASGKQQVQPLSPWSVAGPLCFAGDFVARNRQLPPLHRGDLVVIRDTGAYTLSMYSRYNSRSLPAVAVVHEGDVSVVRPPETDDHVVRSWTGQIDPG